jgi:hypothetical protein
MKKYLYIALALAMVSILLAGCSLGERRNRTTATPEPALPASTILPAVVDASPTPAPVEQSQIVQPTQTILPPPIVLSSTSTLAAPVVEQSDQIGSEVDALLNELDSLLNNTDTLPDSP